MMEMRRESQEAGQGGPYLCNLATVAYETGSSIPSLMSIGEGNGAVSDFDMHGIDVNTFVPWRILFTASHGMTVGDGVQDPKVGTSRSIRSYENSRRLGLWMWSMEMARRCARYKHTS